MNPRVTLEWLADRRVRRRDPHPARSPDIVGVRVAVCAAAARLGKALCVALPKQPPRPPSLSYMFADSCAHASRPSPLYPATIMIRTGTVGSPPVDAGVVGVGTVTFSVTVVVPPPHALKAASRKIDMSTLPVGR